MKRNDESKSKIVLPDPKAEVNELLIAAQYLYTKPEWRTTFPGLMVGSGLLSSAHRDLERCIRTLRLIVGGGRVMLNNNCQCDLCRSVWEGTGYMKNGELCADDVKWTEEVYPSAYDELTISKSMEQLHENN